MTNLQGTTALITGGGSGIGLATASLFLEAGANVVIVGRTASRLEDAARRLNAGDRLRWFTGDISSEGHAKAVIHNTLQAFHRVDYLINNAGIFQGGSLLEMEEDNFDYNIDVNLKGSWFMCRYAARPMIDNGGGAIVNVSSYLAIRAHPSTPCSAYAASKAGLLGLTTALAVELAPHKIRVNAVLPALIHTPMLETAAPPEMIPEILEKSKRLHPLGRIGEPIDVARAIFYLSDPANDWITGVQMDIDGGRALL